MTPPMNLPPLLAKNLRALARVDGKMAARLCLPVDDGHILTGPPRLKVHRSVFPLALEIEGLDCIPASDGNKATLLVFGVGLGEQVQRALDLGWTVVAWDRDPSMLRLALSHQDWKAALKSGALTLALGADLLDHLEKTPIIHPLLGQIYRHEKALLGCADPGPMVLLCSGGLFVDDLASALAQQGYKVFSWDIHRLAHSELDRTVKRVKPEFVAVINHTHGLAEACRAHGLPLMVWEIDPATDGLRSVAGSTDHVAVFTYRQANVASFERAGFRNVRYLPLAANTERRMPDPQAELGPILCFVGASMVDQATRFRGEFLDAWVAYRSKRDGAVEEAKAVLERVLRAQRAAGRSYVVPDLMAMHMGDFLTQSSRLLAHDPVAMVGEMAAAERRLNTVARLGPEGIEVWGDAGWGAVTRTGAVYRGFAGHDRALTQIYQQGLIHVDVGRLYQLDIVPMRIFDILACGGFVIADHSEALEDLFEVGVELETWKTSEELLAKVKHYRANPAEVRAIASRGLSAVQQRHSIAERVSKMCSLLPGRGYRSAG